MNKKGAFIKKLQLDIFSEKRYYQKRNTTFHDTILCLFFNILLIRGAFRGLTVSDTFRLKKA